MPPSFRFPPLREGNRARVRFPCFARETEKLGRFPPLREGNRARVRFPLRAGLEG